MRMLGRITDAQEVVTLMLQPAHGLWHGYAHILLGLERIMEDDDRPVASVALHIADDRLGAELRVVVTRDDIPHHDLKAVAELPVLRKA